MNLKKKSTYQLFIDDLFPDMSNSIKDISYVKNKNTR